jgi:DNA-binding transcriptional MerR regulator
MTAPMSISELAHAAGLSRRAIRFYVQQKLLPAPNGLGRGKHYDPSHLERLHQIRQLQQAGHSLDQIRQMLDNGTPTLSRERSEHAPSPPPAPFLRAELWRRIPIAPGLELSFDATRLNPTVEDLIQLRRAILQLTNPKTDNEQ